MKYIFLFLVFFTHFIYAETLTDTKISELLIGKWQLEHKQVHPENGMEYILVGVGTYFKDNTANFIGDYFVIMPGFFKFHYRVDSNTTWKVEDNYIIETIESFTFTLQEQTNLLTNKTETFTDGEVEEIAKGTVDKSLVVDINENRKVLMTDNEILTATRY